MPRKPEFNEQLYNVIDNCKDFQDCVLTLHHTYMHTFSTSNAIKIVENHNGDAMIMGMKHSK